MADESQKTEPTPAAQEGLQFDRAEPVKKRPPSRTCARCKHQLEQVYYQIDTEAVCPACCEKQAAALTGGSGTERFVKAGIAGLVAALVGTGIYFAILASTGYNIGLIALLVGFMVGGAVRWGSNQRGGWVYQLLAVSLTYLAIDATFVMEVGRQFLKRNPTVATARQNPQPAPAAAKAAKAAPAEEEAIEDEPASETAAPASPPMSLGESIIALLKLIGLILILPILIGFYGSIISVLITGFALYQAWSLNKRMEHRITGPFQIAVAGGAALAATAPVAKQE